MAGFGRRALHTGLLRAGLLGTTMSAATLSMGPLARPARAQNGSGTERPALGRLVEAERALPAIGWTDADGAPRTPADFVGQGMVINLWATWCAPCVAEMPALDRLAAFVAGDGIAVLPLSSDRGGRAQVEGFYGQRGLKTLRIWLDPRGAAMRALGVRGLPTTVIVDRAGRERARLEGEAPWDQPEWVAAVRRLAGAGGGVPEPANRAT